ncbi:MAG: TIGR03067 domain-containing protein [Planctomycetia bacterium]|nr:TIGR03067 domain-containing protein [Planctomycetia bacterium]
MRPGGGGRTDRRRVGVAAVMRAAAAAGAMGVVTLPAAPADSLHVRAVAAEAGDADSDRLLIEGAWRVVSIEVDGTVNESDDVRRITTRNGRDGAWTLFVDGVELAAGTSAIDASATPKTIDLEFTSGPNAGRTSYGIYEATRSSRRICYAEAGRARPGAFSTEAGSGRTLVVFERVEAAR